MLVFLKEISSHNMTSVLFNHGVHKCMVADHVCTSCSVGSVEVTVRGDMAFVEYCHVILAIQSEE